MIRRILLSLAVLTFIAAPIIARISDSEGDADIPCIDISSLDDRGDTTSLTVMIQDGSAQDVTAVWIEEQSKSVLTRLAMAHH